MSAQGIRRLGLRADAVLLQGDTRRASVRALAAEKDAVIALACEVARVILGREAEAGPNVWLEVTERALARLRGAALVVLRVNPDDLAVANTLAGEAREGEQLEILVRADPTVDRGGVIAEADVGAVDARLSVQIERIEQILADRRPIV